MIAEVNEAQKFLKNKFGNREPKAGTYAVPTKTSNGCAFMKVTLGEDFRLGDFGLYKDEKLTEKWHR